jgi:hypothetical protein
MASPLFPAQSRDFRDALARAAELWGTEQNYWDIFGTRHFATEEVIQAILPSPGVDTVSTVAIDTAFRGRCERQEWREN